MGQTLLFLGWLIVMNHPVVWSRSKVLLPWEEDFDDLGQPQVAKCWAAAIASLNVSLRMCPTGCHRLTVNGQESAVTAPNLFPGSGVATLVA